MTGSAHVKVAGGEALVQNSINERVIAEIPSIVKEALDKVRNFQRPDTLAGSKYDEEIVEAMEQARYAQQVATGMFYRWIFPRGEAPSLIDEWFAARKLYRKEQRYKLFENVEFLDSPGNLEDAAKRFWGDAPTHDLEGRPLPQWKSEAWPRWRDVMDKVAPETQAVRLHDFLVLDAIEWAHQNRGIIWYNMVEFAQWMGELSGFPIHAGGRNADRAIRNERGDRPIISSIASNGRGRNGLQYLYNKQLIAQTPASARRYEQLLARLHRNGQKDLIVTTDVYLHVPEIAKSFENALMKAKYVTETTIQNQRITDGWGGSDDD